MLLKLTRILEHCEAMETYSRIGILRSYGNLQSYWTNAKLWKLTVVLEYLILPFDHSCKVWMEAIAQDVDQ